MQHKLREFFVGTYLLHQASPVAQQVKSLAAMQETWETQETKETWVCSLGWEDRIEEEMATHSSILVWKIPWTEEPGRLQFTGSQRVRHTYIHTHLLLTCSVCSPVCPTILLCFTLLYKY